MATSYEKVFDSFLSKVVDVDLPRMREEDMISELLTFLHSALMEIDTSNLKFQSDLSLYDDHAMEFEEDLSITEIEVISMYMVAAWYNRSINSLGHTKMLVTSNSEKYTDQSKHLSSMIEARDYWIVEARKRFRNKNILSNDYLIDD